MEPLDRSLTRIGPYRLRSKLAAGGMAELFLAEFDGAAGFVRPVVVKRLFRDLVEREPSLHLFQAEARLLSMFSHPGVPQVYDLNVDGDEWYIALEFVDGPTLADALRFASRQKVVLPTAVALSMIHQLAEALHHVHERRDPRGHSLRCVHRDLTPHNVMITRDGVVKVVDFGLSISTLRTEIEHGAMRGTLGYMSPEQIQGLSLDRRSDLFSLGILLYELTTGVRLFSGSEVQVMTATVEKDVALPSSLQPGYPSELETVVMALLSRDRRGRMASASTLSVALEDIAKRQGWLLGPRAVAKFIASVQSTVPRTEGARPPSEPPIEPAPTETSMAMTFAHTATGGFAFGVFDHQDIDTVNRATANGIESPPQSDGASEED